jgi:hypothetical protein
MSLFSDPAGSIRSRFGSPIQLGGAICWQLIIGAALTLKNGIGHTSVAFGLFILPCMIYYATYRLLKLYDSKVGEPGNWRKVPDWFIFLIYILAGLVIYILV